LVVHPEKRHVLTTAVEHSANIKFGDFLKKQGYSVTLLPVEPDGSLDLHLLEKSIRPDTAIVSVMWANNETGVLFPIEEIAAICRSKGVVFHTDAVQVAGKLKIDVKEQGRAMLGAAAEVEGQLIAAQTELEGLRQIYTDSNVRVRSVQARIAELRRQLQKMGGKPGSTDSTAPPATDDRYPAIRELPILGVTYADLFRRTKVEEVVFETLTKQYELARVEEARETPSVKVLDEGDVPEKKSFPPRLVVILLGSLFVGAMGCVWLLATSRWQQIEPDNPGKILARDVLQTVKSKMPWNHHNGSRDQRSGLDPQDSA